MSAGEDVARPPAGAPGAGVEGAPGVGAPVPDAYRLRGSLLVTLAALSAFGPMSLDLYLPAFPSIAESLAVSPADVQVTFSACLIGLGLGQLVYGPLSDRFGRKPPLVAGLALYVVASILCAVAPSLAMLTGMRLLQGLGGCAGMVIARAIVRDCFAGPALARSFSVITSVAMLAPLVAPSLGAGIMRVAGWRAMFVVIAAFGAACLVATFFLPETHGRDRRLAHGARDAARGYGELLRHRRFLVPAAVVVLAAGTLMAYISSSSVVFMEGYGIAPSAFALVFGLLAACFIAGLRTNIVLLRRHPSYVLVRAYVLIEVPVLLALLGLFVLGAPAWAPLTAIGVVMFCLGGTLPNATAETMEPFARNAGSASALLGTMQMGFAGILAATLAALSFTPSLEMTVAMLAMAVASCALAAVRRA